MVLDGYIKKQKAVWVYEKMRKKDPQWVEKRTHFKNLLENYYN
jgi:hypothetical protein